MTKFTGQFTRCILAGLTGLFVATLSPAQTPAPTPPPEEISLRGQIGKTERKILFDQPRIQYSLKMNDGRVPLPEMPRTDGTSVVINLDEFVDQFVEMRVIGRNTRVDDQLWVTVESIQSVHKITEDEALGLETLPLSGTLRKIERTITVDESNQTTRASFSLENNGSLTPLPVPMAKESSTLSASDFDALIGQEVQLVVKATRLQRGTNQSELTVREVMEMKATHPTETTAPQGQIPTSSPPADQSAAEEPTPF